MPETEANKMDETRVVLARLDERTEVVLERVDRLTHVLLEGNGVPAVTVQLATLTEKVATLEETNRDKRVPRHVWLAISVSLLIGVISILVALKA